MKYPLLFFLLWALPLQAGGLYSKKYDKWIENAVELYMPGTHPVWWKAQLIAESRLDPTARSDVGAIGISQIMPATWVCCVRKAIGLGLVASPTDAKHGIDGGAYYMGQKMFKMWGRAGRSATDHYLLAAACYNAGCKYLYDAQKLANGALDFSSIMAKLPQVKRVDHKQVKDYTTRIRKVALYLLTD